MRGWPVVDSVQFARTRGEVHCSIAISELGRLARTVSADEGEIGVQLDGFEDPDGRLGLRLRVTGDVQLVCQRCLGPLKLNVATDRSFLLAEREQDIPGLEEEDDDVETLLADSRLDVAVLAEDEFLLQIPMSPVHDDGLCARPEWGGDRRDSGTAFGALGALINTED